MKREDFERLVTFWSLRSTISDGEDLGRKTDEHGIIQIKRIRLDSKNYQVHLRYSVSDFTDEFIIISAEVYDRRTHLNDIMYGQNAIDILEKL